MALAAFGAYHNQVSPYGVGAIGVLAVTALVTGLIWGHLARLADTQKTAALLSGLIAADAKAYLVVAGNGEESYRNGTLLGSADDPLAPFMIRAENDDRAQGEILRLQAAALVGATRRTEISLGTPDGGRDWYQLATFPLPRPQASPGQTTPPQVWVAEDITARFAIEETLRREWETISDFVDLLPVGCYSADTSGNLRWINQRLAEWLGHKPSELTGKSLDDIMGATPDPESGRAEIRLRGRGGEHFQALVAHTVFDDGGETLTRSVVMRDPVSEHQWERALRSAERRFRWLFDDAPVGIAVVELDGTIGTCNLALQAMLGIDAESLNGRPVTNYVAPEHRQTATEELAKVLGGSVTGTHLEVKLKGRRDVIAQLFVSPTHEDGDISGLIIHFIDATDQRNLEVQFAQSQKMQAMGQLAGGVAHDFNNLLTAMIGFSDLLLQRHGPGDPSFADIMQIKQNANRAASLVRQLLAFSRRQALQPRLLNVTDALADLSNLLRRLLGETIELKMIHGRNLGMIRVDPGQFDQVIINLSVNARDAMMGGGTLTIRTGTTTVMEPIRRGPELMPAGEYVVIEVSDTGTGIPKDYLPRIFEPFFSTKEVGAGTGLGLSTVYGIVRQTDGFIVVDSEPGHGSTFTISLPRVEADAAQTGGAASTAESGPGSSPHSTVPSPAHRSAAGEQEGVPQSDLTGSATVLLVEDETAVRTFGARALKNKGYRVIEAASGEQALEVLQEVDQIDVLISDVVMPGIDGVSLARLVHQEHPKIRIILISGYSEDVARDGIDPNEGFHFLPKPFSLKQLAEAVKLVTQD